MWNITEVRGDGRTVYPPGSFTVSSYTPVPHYEFDVIRHRRQAKFPGRAITGLMDKLID
jgi:hypothetical protein